MPIKGERMKSLGLDGWGTNRNSRYGMILWMKKKKKRNKTEREREGGRKGEKGEKELYMLACLYNYIHMFA